MFAVGLLNLIKAGYSGVLPSLLAEQFPVDTRAVGIAFSYGIAVTIFGGFAPFVGGTSNPYLLTHYPQPI